MNQRTRPLDPLNGTGTVQQEGEEAIHVTYRLRRKQIEVKTEQAGWLPGAGYIEGGEITTSKVTLADNSIMTLKAPEQQIEITIIVSCEIRPYTYKIAIR